MILACEAVVPYVQPQGNASAADTGGFTAPESSADTDSPDTRPPTGGVIFTPDSGEAIDLTEEFTDGDFTTIDRDGTLTFSPGTWFVRLTVHTASVSIVGTGGVDETILSAGEQGSVVHLKGAFSSASIQGVTIERGEAIGGSDDDMRVGGGVRCEGSGTLRITDAVVRDNVAGDGGGLYAGSACSLELERVTVSGNYAEDDGGGMLIDHSSLSIVDSVVSDNEAADAGGIYGLRSTLLIDGVTFSGNQASVDDFGEGGGALMLYLQSSATITDTDFTDNRCANGGAALFSSGQIVMERVSFSDNTSMLGGGILLYSSAMLTAVDINFTRNDPEDLYHHFSASSGQSHDWGEGASFFCHGTVCEDSP